MLNLLIFLSMPDVVIVMTLEDRVKNTSLWLWIGEFLVRGVFIILYGVGGYGLSALGGMRCRPTIFGRREMPRSGLSAALHEVPRYILLCGFGAFVDVGGG